jgi:hypothetical protein
MRWWKVKTIADVNQSNGVIHVVDTVVLKTIKVGLKLMFIEKPALLCRAIFFISISFN